MNDAYAPPPAPSSAFADRQSRGDSKECCRPALLSERGVSMTEDEAYKMHIQYTFNALCKIWILKTGGSGQTANLSGNGAESITSRKPRRSAAAALFR